MPYTPEKQCESCGAVMLRVGPNRKRCDACRGGRCRVCGKSRTLQPSMSVSVYCSRQCRDAGIRGTHRALIETPCAVCGVGVFRVPSRAKPPVYCSKACSTSACAKGASVRMAARLRAGWVPPPMTWCHYECRIGDKHRFRSKWELDFAKRLDQLEVWWVYEPQKFDVAGRPYTPDFFVHTPFGRCYVELHRMIAVLPGDEAKVARLTGLSVVGINGIPLIVLDDYDVRDVQKALTRHARELRKQVHDDDRARAEE